MKKIKNQTRIEMSKNLDLNDYKGKKVLITGGLGFIGSNIANELVNLGAEVTIIDNLAPLYGGNYFNIKDIKDKIKVIIGDIRDWQLIDKVILDKDIIFNLAAQVSYIDSVNIPFDDLDINCKGHLTILESCRKLNKNVKIVFSSSRLALGKILENPITEDHPTNPLSLYGIHKLTAEKYCYFYYKNYGLRTTVLRLTNPYGERQQMKHSKYSIPGWFMRLAMEGKTIKIFGKGTQKRDYIHIDDLVNAFLYTGISKETDGQIYNCGSGKSIEFKEMVENIVKSVGKGKIEYVPWPDNYEKDETADKIKTSVEKLFKATGWKPKINLKEGLNRMYDYYKNNKDKYITIE